MMSGGGSFGSLGLHIGQDWSTHLSTYPDHAPILTIAAGSTTVTVYISGTEVTAAVMEFARELTEQSVAFAAEMARIHAWQHPDSSSGDGTPGEAA